MLMMLCEVEGVLTFCLGGVVNDELTSRIVFLCLIRGTVLLFLATLITFVSIAFNGVRNIGVFNCCCCCCCFCFLFGDSNSNDEDSRGGGESSDLDGLTRC